MQDWKIWIVIVVLAVVNLAVHPLIFRVDLTADKRYSLSDQTKEMLQDLEEPMEVVVLLEGKMNSSFLRLQTATVQMLEGKMDKETFNYRGIELQISKDKIQKYHTYKGIPFDEMEIDVYVCCEYRKEFDEPLEHISEIGCEKLEKIVDKYLDREIRIGEFK